ncbi:T9SS type A sorting domain-containing protein [Longibacter salinarum]|uniref:T9SS type A sorting domain-containing protein n=1 Tax=Longibacter salinarum TaxID=1850348 RepID=UPI0015CF500F|nr:T9SS type A sorting domain-containing protein [Longibacter salinarum]
MEVQGDLTVESGGQYGTPGGEDSEMKYGGFDFSIIGTAGFDTNKLTFNNGGSTSSKPLLASGEVFSEVQITGNTYVRISTLFEVNGFLSIESEELNVQSGGSLIINDDFSVGVSATYSPSTSSSTIFTGQTNTGSGGTYDPSESTCTSNGGESTSDGDCEQDVRALGALDLGPVEVDDQDTRVVIATDEGNTNIPNVTSLDIDPGSDDSNVQFVLNNTDIIITGDVVNNGIFLPGGKRVFFKGTSQSITSTEPLEFFDVTVESTGSSDIDVSINPGADITVENQLDIVQGGLGFAGTVSDDASVTLLNQLKMSGGILDTERGSVTLVSKGAETGVDDAEAFVTYIDDDLSGAGDGNLDGEIRGDIVKQRELTGPSSWYFIGSPASTGTNDTFEAFLELGTGTNDLWTQGFVGSDGENAPASASNVRIMDESQPGIDDNGYVSIGAISDATVSGRGYLVYVYGDDNFDGSVTAGETFPKLLDSDLEPYNGKSFDYTADGPGISVTDNGDGAQAGNDQVDIDEGWNLLSNPYLATISWDALTKTNLDDAVYVWDPINRQFLTYSGGSGDLTNGYIAPQQSFLVKATDNTSLPATFNLAIDDITTAQANTSDFFQKSETFEPPVIKIAGEMAGQERSAYLTLLDGGTIQKDRYDAYELGAPVSGSRGAFSIFTTLDNGTGLSINALPSEITKETSIPLETVARGCVGGLPFSGTVTLTWPEIKNLPDKVGLTLRDTETGDVIDLRSQNDYQFQLTANTTCSNAVAKSSSDLQAAPTPQIMTASASKSTPGTRFELVISPNGVLPVEIGSFTGSLDGESAAIMEWTTLSETSNSGFYVEQKVDGSYQTVSSLIEGAGTTTEQQSYRFRVEDLEEGTTHTFRLRQVDVDGATSYSETVDVKVGIQDAYKLEAYPNPVANGQQPTVRFAVDKSQPVTIELYNTLGQRVRTLYNDTPRVTGEFQKVQVDVNSLASGVYFIRMRGESFATTKKLVVVR